MLRVLSTPARFSEWSFATWELQLEKMNGGAGPNFHFMGLYHSDDGGVMKTTKETMIGKVMSAWWDQSEEAGPKTRPNCQFSVPLPSLDVLALSDGKLKTLGLQRFSLPLIFYAVTTYIIIQQ